MRNALEDWRHVPSHLKFQGDDAREPLVTIIITTYQRPRLLTEALRSALAQDFAYEIEILVVDNDPQTESLAHILGEFPNLKSLNFRYYVHGENIGIFGNFNRSLELARGNWVTILNDDDLLDRNCLRLLYDELADYPDMDGIICEKRVLDQRPSDRNAFIVVRPPAPKMNAASALRLLAGLQGGWPVLIERLTDRLAFELKYFGRRSRRISPRLFFWGAMLGNGVGYLFKRRAALAIGGFYPEDFPAADLFQFTRFASQFHLRQHRAAAATFRLAENESAKLETMLRGMEQALRLQRLMIGHQVPRWWGRLSPAVMAFHLRHNRQFLRAELPRHIAEERLKIGIPKDRPVLLLTIRHLLRGF